MRTPVSQLTDGSVEKTTTRTSKGRNLRRVLLRSTPKYTPIVDDEYMDKPPHCYECGVDFINEPALFSHLLYHIKQPCVKLHQLHQPLKITLKTTDSINFRIVSPIPTSEKVKGAGSDEKESEAEPEVTEAEPDIKEPGPEVKEAEPEVKEAESDVKEAEPEVKEAEPVVKEADPEEKEAETLNSPEEVEEQNTTNTDILNEERASSPPTLTVDNKVVEEAGHNDPTTTPTPEIIPGAEPTPPPESTSPVVGLPKIRIKTTGLLKEPITTEVTDNSLPFHVEEPNATQYWETPSLEDPLNISEDKDDNILSNLLNNDNDQAKALGISSSESEFISMGNTERNSAMQLYNPKSTNPLDNLTNLPMEQLAQQVSRLQSSSNGGMHQQNVLINIQQFPQAPPPSGYRPPPPPLYPPMHPPHPGMRAPSMYPPPYQYPGFRPQMYYPQRPNYPPHLQGPPISQPHMTQHMSVSQGQPSRMTQHMAVSQGQPPRMTQAPQQRMPPPLQPVQYRPPMGPMGPRAYGPQRGPVPVQGPGPRPIPIGKQRPMLRPRAPVPNSMVKRPPLRARVPSKTLTNLMNGGGQLKQNKRPSEQSSTSIKKKRMDVLVPDKNDDADCQVIAVQPRNKDGGLPQIQSVQGGQGDPLDNSIMHLSDSITLSVRNPQVISSNPKNSDPKAVANILATRGITVTASGKNKDRNSPSKESATITPVSINLNSAVSIIPNAKKAKNTATTLPTVDLTEDQPKTPSSSKTQSPTLAHKCDVCLAQFASPIRLKKHRLTHRNRAVSELGVPLVDMRKPEVLEKMKAMGICNFVPLKYEGGDGRFLMPVISLNSIKNSTTNLEAMGINSMVSLGPLRTLSSNTKK